MLLGTIYFFMRLGGGGCLVRFEGGGGPCEKKLASKGDAGQRKLKEKGIRRKN